MITRCEYLVSNQCAKNPSNFMGFLLTSAHNNMSSSGHIASQTDIDLDDCMSHCHAYSLVSLAYSPKMTDHTSVVHPSMTEGITAFPLVNRSSQATQPRRTLKDLHPVNIEEMQELDTSEPAARSSKHVSRGNGTGGSEGGDANGHHRREIDSGIRALPDSGVTESALPPIYTDD